MDKNKLLARKFGLIVINKGYATREDINRALVIQKRNAAEGGENTRIGQILVDLEIITDEQLQEILLCQKKQKKSSSPIAEAAPQSEKSELKETPRHESAQNELAARKFGLIAINKGYATREDINQALGIQKENFAADKKPFQLGQVLMDLNVINDLQRQEILQLQKKKKPAAGADKKDPEAPPIPLEKEASLTDTADTDPDKGEHTENQPRDSIQTRLQGRRLGMLAVRKGLIDRKVIDQGIAVQKQNAAEGKPFMRLGDILVDLGAITTDQRDTLRQTLAIDSPPTPEADGSEDAVDTVAVEGKKEAYKLTVSVDLTKAFICVKTDESHDITLDEIKALLEEKGITHGVFSDAVIDECLKAKPNSGKSWQIAAGKAPEPGKPPETKYHFDVAPEGGIKDNGHHSVAQGTLLAEIIPGEQGKAGIDIYGQPIPPPDPEYPDFKFGPGVEISSDGLKLTAAIEGRPEVTAQGEVCVIPYLEIDGDVGLNSEDIDFDGHIVIKGSIQEKVNIKGKSLRVHQISDARVNIEGDIIIQRGASGAKIKSGGGVQIKHVHKSNLEAKGNVFIENEVVDSSIETNGRCVIENGRIMSSKVVAKKGIKASEIGSNGSNPCVLDVGIDYWVQKKIEALKNDIAENEDKKGQLVSGMEALQKDNDGLEEKIAEIADEEGPIRIQHVKLQQQLDESKGNTEPIKAAETALAQTEEKLAQLSDKTADLFEKHEQLENEIENKKAALKDAEQKKAKLNANIDNLLHLSEQDKGQAVVDVLGTVFAQTFVKGPHSKLTIPEDQNHISIQEINISPPGKPPKWNMKISNIN